MCEHEDGYLTEAEAFKKHTFKLAVAFHPTVGRPGGRARLLEHVGYLDSFRALSSP
jgi:hypothetical protein